MDHHDWLAEHFEANRDRLRAVAYRMLGSPSDADDAVQEAWLRLARAGGIENLSGWLTTVVARICLDMLRAREARPEQPLDAPAPEPVASRKDGTDPEYEALLGDSVGLALLVVLDTLTPSERVAFVLHDVFDLPFDEIAPIVERTPTAARQLASRARRRVQGKVAMTGGDDGRQRAIVAAFLAAAREGDFTALLALLDPAVTLRADDAAVRMGAEPDVHGATAVANTFAARRARAARLALLNGAVGAVFAPGGRLRVAFAFTITDEKISAISLIADAARLGELDVTIIKG